MGGTFDPFHNGHLETVLDIRKSTGLDKIILVPANSPPHKEIDSAARALHRYTMAVLSTIKYSFLEVSPYEIIQGGVSYTYKTLNAFREKLPDGDELYFITGIESFDKITTWKEWMFLVDEFTFIINTREGFKTRELFRHIPEHLAKRCVLTKGKMINLDEEKQKGNMLIDYTKQIDISGTMIREKIRSGETIEGLVDHKVKRYLEMHALYMR
jgi:nicotinate-nucleotide adenylyltransferase